MIQCPLLDANLSLASMTTALSVCQARSIETERPPLLFLEQGAICSLYKPTSQGVLNEPHTV